VYTPRDSHRRKSLPKAGLRQKYFFLNRPILPRGDNDFRRKSTGRVGGGRGGLGERPMTRGIGQRFAGLLPAAGKAVVLALMIHAARQKHARLMHECGLGGVAEFHRRAVEPMQHFLNLRPLPHTQGSLGPTLANSGSGAKRGGGSGRSSSSPLPMRSRNRPQVLS